MRYTISLRIEFDREDDGRWIAEASGIPDVAPILVYGDSQADAADRVLGVAFRVIGERIEAGEMEPSSVELIGV